jgi:hypothetical protein
VTRPTLASGLSLPSPIVDNEVNTPGRLEFKIIKWIEPLGEASFQLFPNLLGELRRKVVSKLARSTPISQNFETKLLTRGLLKLLFLTIFPNELLTNNMVS